MVAILGYSKEQISEAVRDMYAGVASNPDGGFHFPTGRSTAETLGYPAEDLDRLPEAAVTAFAGVGNPFLADAIRPGDTVLDIGAGSGTDTFIASQKTGHAGKVYAIDLTPEMADLLRRTAFAAEVANIEVLHGDAETLPLPDNSVDVVTSNGALNLIPNKRKAFAEIYRVLRPGGRVQIADIVISRPVPLGGRRDPELWAECVVGASVDEDYLALFREAGFTNLRTLNEWDYFAKSPSADTRRIAATLGARSITLAMDRPDTATQASSGRSSSWMRRMNPLRLARRIGALGLWGAVAGVASLAACYGTLGVLALASILGAGLAINEALWAVAITTTAVLAVMATAVNLPRHRQIWPLVGAVIGGGTIAFVMLVSYSFIVEGIGFSILLASIAADLYLIYRAECLPKRGNPRLGPARAA